MTPTPDVARAQELYLALVRATEALNAPFVALFREHGLTMPQFNVLRILLGGPAEGTSCQYVGDRLLTRVPDVTRLLDRMEAAGLVARSRSAEDRRVVLVRVTETGREACEALRQPVLDLHREQLAHLAPETMQALLEGLRELTKAPRREPDRSDDRHPPTGR